MSDLSIIIPHRGDGLGLWATVASCMDDLTDSGYEHDFVVVTNGEAVSEETAQTLHHLDKAGLLKAHVHSPEALTPPVARARGVAASDGEFLFFFDNHCIVGKRYFERAMADMDHWNMDMLHSATKFYPADLDHYHYKLTLEYNFWGEGGSQPCNIYKPYQIAAGGHGGFIVRRTAWDRVGGYGPDALFTGYGGEEMAFDLKMWRMGGDNWLDPKLVHYHWPGKRGYSRHYSDEYYTNMLTCALVIGGEKWLYKVYDSFSNPRQLRLRPEKSMFDLLQTAYERGIAYSRELDSKSALSLDEALAMFRRNQVAYR